MSIPISEKADAIRNAYVNNTYGLKTGGVCEELIEDRYLSDMDECNFFAKILTPGIGGICDEDEKKDMQMAGYGNEFFTALCGWKGIQAFEERFLVLLLRAQCNNFLDFVSYKKYDDYHLCTTDDWLVNYNRISMIQELGSIYCFVTEAYQDDIKRTLQDITNHGGQPMNLRQAASFYLAKFNEPGICIQTPAHRARNPASYDAGEEIM